MITVTMTTIPVAKYGVRVRICRLHAPGQAELHESATGVTLEADLDVPELSKLPEEFIDDADPIGLRGDVRHQQAVPVLAPRPPVGTATAGGVGCSLLDDKAEFLVPEGAVEDGWGRVDLGGTVRQELGIGVRAVAFRRWRGRP